MVKWFSTLFDMYKWFLALIGLTMLINLIFKLFLCYLIEKDYQALIHLYINIKKKMGKGSYFFYMYIKKKMILLLKEIIMSIVMRFWRERERGIEVKRWKKCWRKNILTFTIFTFFNSIMVRNLTEAKIKLKYFHKMIYTQLLITNYAKDKFRPWKK